MNIFETPGALLEPRSESCLVLSRDGKPGLDAVWKIEQFFIK
jgi:hypothetical protein